MLPVADPAIVFGDAAAAIVSLLGGALPLIPVYSRVPDPRPTEFVLAYRTGGVRRNLVVDDAIIAVEGWSYQDERAHDLCQQARAAIHAAKGDRFGSELLLVCRVDELGGPALLPDALSEQTRYTLTLQVSLRAVNA